MNTDGNAQNLGQLVILPSTHVGNPRHMHEYAQGAMTYVRNYGTPDLFITFTSNPKWNEIKRELHQGKKPEDRHDIIARVLRDDGCDREASSVRHYKVLDVFVQVAETRSTPRTYSDLADEQIAV